MKVFRVCEGIKVIKYMSNTLLILIFFSQLMINHHQQLIFKYLRFQTLQNLHVGHHLLVSCMMINHQQLIFLQDTVPTGLNVEQLTRGPSFNHSMQIILDEFFSSNHEIAAAVHLKTLQQPLQSHEKSLFRLLMLEVRNRINYANF